MLLLNN